MCTAVSCGRFFGRNFDYDISYGEQIAVTPRRAPLAFRHAQPIDTHLAFIGTATLAGDCPLYYDATNERGLSMAGLYFPESAAYFPEKPGADNVAPFEFIPWILAQCENVAQARALVARLNLLNLPFSAQLPLAPLHWIIADADASIVVESMRDGLHVHENPVDVLTNEPPFDFHRQNLRFYLNLTPQEPENRFAAGLPLTPYGRGMGAIGLPGDVSSASRFVRAAFLRHNAHFSGDEQRDVSQFFHILGAVAQVRGCVPMGGERFEMTRYASCCDTARGVYYYTTYDNARINAVDLRREQLDGMVPTSYPMRDDPDIFVQNG